MTWWVAAPWCLAGNAASLEKQLSANENSTLSRKEGLRMRVPPRIGTNVNHDAFYCVHTHTHTLRQAGLNADERKKGREGEGRRGRVVEPAVNRGLKETEPCWMFSGIVVFQVVFNTNLRTPSSCRSSIRAPSSRFVDATQASDPHLVDFSPYASSTHKKVFTSFCFTTHCFSVQRLHHAGGGSMEDNRGTKVMVTLFFP